MFKENNKKIFQGFFYLLIINLVLFCVFIVFLEFFLRVFLIHKYRPHPKYLYQSDDKVIFKFSPNFTGKYIRDEFTTVIQTNSKGLRNEEFDENKNADIRRILAIGDSITAGMEVDIQQTFVKQLEKILQKASNNVRIEVINAGIPAYGPDHELSFLKNYGFSYNPDLILVNFFVGNDIRDLSIGMSNRVIVKDGYLFNNYLAKKYLKEGFRKSSNIPIPFKSFLRENSVAYLFLANNIFFKIKKIFKNSSDIKDVPGEGEYINVLKKDYSAQLEKGLLKTFYFFKEINELIVKKGIKLLVVLLPIKEQVDDSNLNNAKSVYNIDINDYDQSKPQNILTKFLEDEGIDYLCILSYIKKNRKIREKMFYEKDSHLNKYGHKIVADAIFNKLSSMDILISQ